MPETETETERLSPLEQKVKNLNDKVTRLSSLPQTPDVVAAIARAKRHLNEIQKEHDQS